MKFRLSKNEMIQFLGLEMEYIDSSSLQLTTALILQETYPLDKYDMMLEVDYDIRYKMNKTNNEICRKNGVVVFI